MFKPLFIHFQVYAIVSYGHGFSDIDLNMLTQLHNYTSFYDRLSKKRRMEGGPPPRIARSRRRHCIV